MTVAEPTGYRVVFDPTELTGRMLYAAASVVALLVTVLSSLWGAR